MIMIKLFHNKTEKKISMKICSLTKKYTKELAIFYFGFYNSREVAKVKVKTDEVLNELGFV